jgi:hypothetical protein
MPTPTPIPAQLVQILLSIPSDTLLVSLLAALVGLVMGWIVGLNGFAQPAKGTTAAEELPRLKNVLWLLSGFGALFIADPKKIGLPDDFSMVGPFIAYGFAAMVSFVAAIAWTLHSIKSSVNQFNQNHAAKNHLDLAELRDEYLYYGKPRFDQKFQSEKQRIEQGLKAADAAKNAYTEEIDRLKNSAEAVKNALTEEIGRVKDTSVVFVGLAIEIFRDLQSVDLSARHRKLATVPLSRKRGSRSRSAWQASHGRAAKSRQEPRGDDNAKGGSLSSNEANQAVPLRTAADFDAGSDWLRRRQQ